MVIFDQLTDICTFFKELSLSFYDLFLKIFLMDEKIDISSELYFLLMNDFLSNFSCLEFIMLRLPKDAHLA
jgi:hypothetical protein